MDDGHQQGAGGVLRDVQVRGNSGVTDGRQIADDIFLYEMELTEVEKKNIETEKKLKIKTPRPRCKGLRG